MEAKLYVNETECRVLERLTGHVRVRMNARRLSRDTVAAAIRFGKVARVRGATIYAIGRKQVSRYAEQLIDLSPYEGVQVVLLRNVSTGEYLRVGRNCNDNHYKIADRWWDEFFRWERLMAWREGLLEKELV